MKRSGMFLRVAIIALVTLAPLAEAAAYIIGSRAILSRMARNHGKGNYAIEQEVQFNTDAEPVVLRERWIVENGDNMRLTVTAVRGAQQNYRLDIVYKDGVRHFINNTELKSAHRSPEFIEPFHHYRSSRSLSEALVRTKIVPREFLKERRRTTEKNVTRYEDEEFVRLARVGGVIAYAMGAPTPPEAVEKYPGIWIEQDAFHLRRLRFPTQAEVTANKFSVYTGGLEFPRERLVTWGAATASLRTLSVRRISDQEAGSLLAPSSLSQISGKIQQQLPDHPQIREFYSRFR